MKAYVNFQGKARWSMFWGDKVKSLFKKTFKKSARQLSKKELRNTFND